MNKLANISIIIVTYKTDENINKYVFCINCAHGKGNIKYIRENLKYFANSIIQKNTLLFKSIVLLNADKLTIDAQSALRRCIEIYNNSTRFFIIVEDKDKIIKPILSRFSELYCRNIIVNYNSIKYYSNIQNNKLVKLLDKIYSDYKLNTKNLNNTSNTSNTSNNDKNTDNENNNFDLLNIIINLTYELYYNGYYAEQIIEYIKNNLHNDCNKYKFIILFNSKKKYIKNEKILIFISLYFLFFRFNIHLENIWFI